MDLSFSDLEQMVAGGSLLQATERVQQVAGAASSAQQRAEWRREGGHCRMMWRVMRLQILQIVIQRDAGQVVIGLFHARLAVLQQSVARIGPLTVIVVVVGVGQVVIVAQFAWNCRFHVKLIS